MWPIRAKPVGPRKYDQDRKKHDKNKEMYYKALCSYTKNLQAYHRYFNFEHPPRVLSLEDTAMISSIRLHQECNIPVEYFDLVSRDVAFSASNKNKHGILYTGEMSNLLKQPRIEMHRYDVINFDSCNTWDTFKDCVELLFRRQLVDIVSVIVITCSSRVSSAEHRQKLAERGGEKMPQHTQIQQCKNDVAEYARAYGYVVCANHHEFSYDSMYCLFFKVVHWESTMSYDGGIPGPWTASYWLQEPMVFDTPTGERIKKAASKKVASKKANILKVKGRPVGKRQRRNTR